MPLLFLINKSQNLNKSQNHINLEQNLKCLIKKIDKIENPDLHQEKERDHRLTIGENVNLLKTELKLVNLNILPNHQNQKLQK